MVEIYSEGLVCLSVCVPDDMPREEVEREVNSRRPTGIKSRWTISSDETFAGGEPHPSPCSDRIFRRHYLLNC